MIDDKTTINKKSRSPTNNLEARENLPNLRLAGSGEVTDRRGHFEIELHQANEFQI